MQLMKLQMSITTLIRDYLLECAQEHKWTEMHYVMGIKVLNMQSGTFVRNAPQNLIYEQTLSWTFLGDNIVLSKTSPDGIYRKDTLKISLCDPESLSKIKSYFVD